MKPRTKSLVSGLFATLAAFVILSFAVPDPITATGQVRLPEKLAGLADLVQLTPADVQALNANEPVSKLLSTNDEHEVAVLGAVWIKAPVKKYVQAMKHIEQLEHGDGFLITRRISDPPRLEDFADLDLPADDVKELKTCRVGKCDVKLDGDVIERIHREIDWSKPTAEADLNALMRQLALDYVTAYQRGGNQELAVYRDHSRPAFVAKEFAAMIAEMSLLQQWEPAVRQYLLDYPKAQLPNAASFLYWQKVKFGLKPVIRINHVVITENSERVLVAAKQLYASHYFWTAIELRELIPDPSLTPKGSGSSTSAGAVRPA